MRTDLKSLLNPFIHFFLEYTVSIYNNMVALIPKHFFAVAIQKVVGITVVDLILVLSHHYTDDSTVAMKNNVPVLRLLVSVKGA